MSRSARSLQDITVANHIMYYNTCLLHDERVITSRLKQVIFVTVQTHNTHTHAHTHTHTHTHTHAEAGRTVRVT